jgi:hypothetical protein
MADEPKTDWQGLALLFGLCLAALIEAVRLMLGHTEDLRDSRVRGVFVIGCLVLAYVYVVVKEEPAFKKTFGALQVILAVLVTWYQITKLGETGWDKGDVIDRCTFLLGSIALLGKGMKDFFEDEWKN